MIVDTLAAVAEKIWTELNGGNPNFEGKPDLPYIEGKAPAYRAEAIQSLFKVVQVAGAAPQQKPDFESIDASWLQTENLTITASEQIADAVYVRVRCPRPLTIHPEQSGMVFTGNQKKNVKFYEVQSMAYAADLLERGDLNSTNIGIVHDGTWLLLYGNLQLKNLFLNWVFADPAEVSTFDPDVSRYPVSQEILDLMVTIGVNRLRPLVQKTTDTIIDSAQTQERPANKMSVV